MLWLLLPTLALGAFEGYFGRVRYSADALNYLNIARALHAGDWRLALNSYWGLGYPAILSLVTPLFPATAAGEWYAVHLVNLAILVATFFSFFALVWTFATASTFAAMLEDAAAERLIVLGGFAIYLSIELTMDNVSRVGPDMLVTCLLFLAVRLLVQLEQQASASRAMVLGLILGVGFVVKAIFLPLTLVFAVTGAIACRKQKGGLTAIVLMLAAAGVFAMPYIAGLSWSAGHFTYGDAGPLNYAWTVNKLEPGGLWQGGGQYGTPIHPAKQVLESPRVYIFDGPFPVTFAPFYNPPYYYEGYRHFFSLRAQVHEAGGNVLRLARILMLQIFVYVLVFCGLLEFKSVLENLRKALVFWPAMLICWAGIWMYVLVFVEARYVAAFLAILCVLVLLALAANAAKRRGYGLIALLLLGCVVTLLANQHDADRDMIGHLRHHQHFDNNDQWLAGQYLQQTGMRPGDKVAVIADLVTATRSTWAYVGGLRIVGILGGSLLESQTVDSDAFWQAAPERQRQILESFQSVGVRLVLAISKPETANAPGWEPIPGTAYWVYRFEK